LAQEGPVVSPSQVMVSSIAAGEKGKELQRLQVFTRSGHLRLKRVETGDPAVRAEIVETARDQFYQVVLRYGGGWHPGSVNHTIRLVTDSPRDPVLTVPFRALVR